MKARIERLKDLERMESSGAISMRPKKEAAVLRRELERLQKYLGGLKNMSFGIAYLSVILIEPFVDIAVLTFAKTKKDAAGSSIFASRLTRTE